MLIPTNNRYLIGYEIQAIVFVSLIENYNEKYMNMVELWISDLFENKNLIKLAENKDNGAIWGSADIIMGLAIAYDWLLPVLSKKSRIQYGTYLLEFQKAVIAEQGGIKRDPSRSDYSNQFYYFDGMLSITGITLFNEGIDDKLVINYISKFIRDIKEHMIPTVNQVSGNNGGWHEGLGYVSRTMTYFTLELEAWRVATGEDLFKQATGLKVLNKWLYYSTQPDGVVVNIGDVSGWPKGWGQEEGRFSALLSARYQDGYSQYIAANVLPTVNQNWPYIIYYLLWFDHTTEQIIPSNLDTAMHFEGIGWASMRDSWSSDATFAIFHSGKYYMGHQHKDQNSFIIFKNAPLAIDNGIYNRGKPRYKSATRFHNTILVGKGRRFNKFDDGDAGQSGASPMHYIADPESSNSNKGDIVLFENSKDYTYVIGNAKNAYQAVRLTEYTRKFLFVKPNIFIILDRIITPNTKHSIRWLLQSENEPVFYGDHIQITNGNGRLFLKNLLPLENTQVVEKVFSGSRFYNNGNYRFELLPVVNKNVNYFLNYLYTDDSNIIEIPKSHLVESESGNFVGVQTLGYVFLIGKTENISSRESYSVMVSSSLNHIITDLLKSSNYEVYQNSKLILAKKSSENGILQFTSTVGGIFDIVLPDLSPDE